MLTVSTLKITPHGEALWRCNEAYKRYEAVEIPDARSLAGVPAAAGQRKPQVCKCRSGYQVGEKYG